MRFSFFLYLGGKKLPLNVNTLRMISSNQNEGVGMGGGNRITKQIGFFDKVYF